MGYCQGKQHASEVGVGDCGQGAEGAWQSSGSWSLLVLVHIPMIWTSSFSVFALFKNANNKNKHLI